MKFITLQVSTKIYHISQTDIQKVYIQKIKTTPCLPSFNSEIDKVVSPTATDTDFEFFS